MANLSNILNNTDKIDFGKFCQIWMNLAYNIWFFIPKLDSDMLLTHFSVAVLLKQNLTSSLLV